MSGNTLRVLVCGTGAASHALVSLISTKPGVEVCVYTRSHEKARSWTDLRGRHRLTATMGAGRGEVVAGPFTVTSDPAPAARGADLVILSLPAFVHDCYLTALAPHLERGSVLVGLPGQCGFEFAVRQCLGDRLRDVTLVNFTSLPWVCRLERFGERVQVAGTKEIVAGAVQPGSAPVRIGDPVPILQSLLGNPAKLVVSGHLLGATLASINATVHPAIMYGRWRDWDGAALDHEPPFYQSIDERAARLIGEIGQEILAIARRIMTELPEVDLSAVIPKFQWYLDTYGPGIADKTDLMAAIRTNSNYAGIRHPMIESTPGRFVPDFGHRFLAEDVPYGLVVSRGISELVDVPTPAIDLVVRWSQDRLGRTYLTQRGLTGSDLGSTRCPQRYGLLTLREVLSLDERAGSTRRS
jgi:NAD/NADP octopine/nopaline dehydrogenase-like protein